MVKQVVLVGMYDDDIKRKVLSTIDIDSKSLNERIAIIETKEIVSRSMITATTMSQVGATNYKRQILPNDKSLQLKSKCATCQMDFLKHRVKRSGKEDDC